MSWGWWPNPVTGEHGIFLVRGRRQRIDASRMRKQTYCGGLYQKLSLTV